MHIVHRWTVYTSIHLFVYMPTYTAIDESVIGVMWGDATPVSHCSYDSATNVVLGLPQLFKYAAASVFTNIFVAYMTVGDKDELVNQYFVMIEEELERLEEDGVIFALKSIPVDIHLKIHVRRAGDAPFLSARTSCISHSGDYGHLRETVIMTRDNDVVTAPRWPYRFAPSSCKKGEEDKLLTLPFVPRWERKPEEELPDVFRTHLTPQIHNYMNQCITALVKEQGKDDKDEKVRKAAAKELGFAVYGYCLARDLFYGFEPLHGSVNLISYVVRVYVCVRVSIHRSSM